MDDAFRKKWHERETTASIARGLVINAAVHLEMAINVYLSRYFAKNDTVREEIMASLFCTNRITFESKVQIFCFLINKYDNEFKIAKPKYAKDLKDIIERRNHFAHLTLDLTDEGFDKTDNIGLGKFSKDIVQVHNYSFEGIDKLLMIIYEYTEEVGKLIK